jgi:hypothetical protein
MADFLRGLAEALGHLSADEALVARRAFRALIEGRAAPAATRAAPPLSPDTAPAAIAGLAARGMLALDGATGAALVSRGLSLRPTTHAAEVGGRPLHVACAVDALGIPAAIGANARVASRCRACGAAVEISLAEGRVARAPAGLCIWAPDFDPARPLDADT